MNFDPNNLFYWMAEKYSQHKTDENKIIFCNEGSSRSSKTWDTFHLIYTFCDHNKYLKKPLEIGVFRRTLKDCREKTYEKDFKGAAKTIGFYNGNDARKENTSPDYYLYGNKIEFRGLDEISEATAYDIVFVNEALEVENENMIDGLKMRCRKLLIYDWNPKYTIHWVFNYEGREDVFFSKTTYKNNKHLEKSVIKDIESKSPWHLDDLHLAEDKRREHPTNIKNGTADKWYFKVYGMGERANKDGLCFPNVNWIDKFPDNIEKIAYGQDFGRKNDPSATVKLGKLGNKLYLELLIYQPTEYPKDLFKLLEAVGVPKDATIWCDSSDPDMISGVRRLGYKHFLGFSKFHGSVNAGIGLINSFEIYIVYNKYFKEEQENYAWKVVRGINLDEPIDKFNHAFDAARYGALANFR